ncbi:NAD-dependent epimerase/dehydratase family protein [Alsobacter sp. R-9]
MTVLVTGAAGFVGCHLIEALAAAFPDSPIVAADAEAPDPVARQVWRGLGRRLIPAAVDVTDRAAVAGLVWRHQPAVIVHAAAVTPTPAQERASPMRVMDVNLGGLANMLDVAGVVPGVRRVIFLSSTGVFGPGVSVDEPCAETVDPRPSNLYGISKRAGEDLVRRWGELTGISATSLRLGSVFGRHERKTPKRGRTSSIARLVAAGRKGRTAKVHGGAIVRDWLDGDDLGAAVARVATAYAVGHPLYHVVGPRVPFAAIVEMLEAAGISARWVDDPKLADVALLEADVRAFVSPARFENEFGPIARTPMEAALGRLVLEPVGEAAE